MKYLFRIGLAVIGMISIVYASDLQARGMDIIIGGENFCKTDTDCKGGTKCHKRTHICIKCATPPFIWTGTDCRCPDNTVQKDDETCVECLSDADCSDNDENTFCNTETNTCFGCPATFERTPDKNGCVCPKDTHEEAGVCVCDNTNKVLENGICKCPKSIKEQCDASDYMGSLNCACCPTSTPVWNKASGELSKCMTCSEATKGKKVWYNAQTHECVECLSHNDCPNSKPNCNPNNVCEACPKTTPLWNGEKCVECLSHSDCPDSKPNCNPDNVCVACPTTAPVWNPAKGVCEACPKKAPLWDGKKCVECLINKDCKNTTQPWCNPTDKICQSCPSDKPKFNSKTYKCEVCPKDHPRWTGKTCACDEGYEEIKGVCYRICGTNQVRKGTTCECTNKCQVYNPQTGECDNNCPEGQVCRTQYSKDACTQSSLYSCYTKKNLANLKKIIGRYNRERLYISDTRMSFQDAASYCEAYDMHLATMPEACNKDNENDSGYSCPNIQGQFSAYHHNSSGDLWINGGNTKDCKRLRVTNTCGNNHFAYNNGSFYALCAENEGHKTAKYSKTTRAILKKYAGWTSKIGETEAIYIAEQNNFTDQEVQHCSEKRNQTTTAKYGAGNYGIACLKRIKCPAGSYCTNNIASAKKCPAGHYCPIATAAPIVCPAGSYCPAGAKAALKCPAGSYCPQKSSAPIKCTKPGYYCPAGAGAAQLCPLGYYCPAGATQARPCSGSALIRRLNCPAGTSVRK